MLKKSRIVPQTNEREIGKHISPVYHGNPAGPADESVNENAHKDQRWKNKKNRQDPVYFHSSSTLQEKGWGNPTPQHHCCGTPCAIAMFTRALCVVLTSGRATNSEITSLNSVTQLSDAAAPCMTLGTISCLSQSSMADL